MNATTISVDSSQASAVSHPTVLPVVPWTSNNQCLILSVQLLSMVTSKHYITNR